MNRFTIQAGAKPFRLANSIVYVQGYEPFALQRLLRLGIKETEILDGYKHMPIIPYYFQGKLRRYNPDIYLPTFNKIIEVKSRFTFDIKFPQNMEKLRATQRAKFESEIQVFNGSGQLLELIV